MQRFYLPGCEAVITGNGILCWLACFNIMDSAYKTICAFLVIFISTNIDEKYSY